MDMSQINEIEKLLDMKYSTTKRLYMWWDKGDCSLIGLIRIYMIQEIEKEIDIRGEHYDEQYRNVLHSLYTDYTT